MAHNTITCSCCGKSVDLDFYGHNKSIVHKMREESLCFDCAFWKERLSSIKPDQYIISGSLYVFHPFKTRLNRWQIKNPQMKFVRDMNTGDVAGGTDLRLIGNLPECFQREFPDQLKFISKDTYEKIANYQGTCCMSKGCYDRYHCFWYDKNIAEPDGAWNKIPPSHKVGNEMCVSFINKFTMYD